MANLDERFLDGPNVGYCSDSDDEETTAQKSNNFPPFDSSSDTPPGGNGGPRTGPKGVLNDYQLHQEELRQAQKERDRFIAERVKRMCVASNRNTEDQNKKDVDEEEDELAKLRQERLDKMRRMRCGRVQELSDKYQFLNVIENGAEDELIIIHIYRDDFDPCKLLNDALLVLSSETLDAKFFKVKATLLNTSDNFEKNALPTLQIYVQGSIVANFVRITDELPDEFDHKDIYRLIQKRDISLKMKS